MKRFTTKTMAVLAIVVGMAATATAQVKKVSVTPLTNDIYRLTYIDQGKCKLKAEVIDKQGNILCSEQFNQDKSFTKQFSLQNLPAGDYDFKVTDSEGIYTTKIKRSDDGSMTTVMGSDGENAKVAVKGMYADPIYLNIYAGSEVLASNEYIDEGTDFSKVYTFENVSTEDITVEVIAVKKVMASAKF